MIIENGSILISGQPQQLKKYLMELNQTEEEEDVEDENQNKKDEVIDISSMPVL